MFVVAIVDEIFAKFFFVFSGWDLKCFDLIGRNEGAQLVSA